MLAFTLFSLESSTFWHFATAQRLKTAGLFVLGMILFSFYFRIIGPDSFLVVWELLNPHAQLLRTRKDQHGSSELTTARICSNIQPEQPPARTTGKPPETAQLTSSELKGIPLGFDSTRFIPHVPNSTRPGTVSFDNNLLEHHPGPDNLKPGRWFAPSQDIRLRCLECGLLGKQAAAPAVSVLSRAKTALKTMLRPWLTTRIPPFQECGEIRVSWKCVCPPSQLRFDAYVTDSPNHKRCGERVGLNVPEEYREAATRFAEGAAGSSESIACSEAATTNTESTAPLPFSCSSNGVNRDGSTAYSSPSTAPSSDTSFPSPPIYDPGTKRYLLLCVKNGPNTTVMRNIDLTVVLNDEVLFHKLRKAHREMRGRYAWNPFVAPQTIQYVKVRIVIVLKAAIY